MLDKILYHSGKPIVDLYSWLMFNMDILWHAPLPDGPKIIAPNHPSTTDPFLVSLLASDQVSILIDDRLFKVPVFGDYLHKVGHVPVVPGNGRAAFDEALRLLEAGRTVAIFPEGSISPLEGGFHKPRTGAARLSLMTGAPVVPVGIYLSRDHIRLIETQIEDKIAVGTWYIDGPYGITVGKAVRFRGDVENREHVRIVSGRIMQHIARLTRESADRMSVPQTGTIRPEPVPANL